MMKHNTTDNTLAAAALGAGTVAVMIPLMQVAYNNIKRKVIEYADNEVSDLQRLARRYQRYCQPHECLLFSGVDFAVIGDSSASQSFNTFYQEKVNKRIPIYFQLHPGTKLSMLYSQEGNNSYGICYDANEWTGRMSSLELTNPIEEAIGYICEYQRLRANAWLVNQSPYEPVTLFFEELKTWFMQLSRLPILDATLSAIIEGRIEYLNEVKLDPEMFQDRHFSARLGLKTNQGYCNNINATIAYVTAILEHKIAPLVHNILSRQSAREHFSGLRRHFQRMIKQGTRFAYYVMRNEPYSPNFLLAELTAPSFSVYRQNAMAISWLDAMIAHLVGSEGFAAVFATPATNTALSVTALPSPNDFIHHGEITLPVLPQFNDLTLDHCLYPDKTMKIGILSPFRKESCVSTLLRLLGHLQQLCVCYAIIDESYDLAGEGGNILVVTIQRLLVDLWLKIISNIAGTVSDSLAFIMVRLKT